MSPKRILVEDAQRESADATLRDLVRESTNVLEVVKRLGLEPAASACQKVRRRIDRLRIDTSHFVRRQGKPGGRKPRWGNDDLRAAVASSTSFRQAIGKLGLIAAGGNYDQVQRRVRELGLDTSHFTGYGWNVGLRYQPAPAVPLEEVLVCGRPTTSHKLKKRLFAAGLKSPVCELCGWADVAADGRIPVELDHINGDKNDNRLVNLRILCPNCHSLQPTHRGLNQRRAQPGVTRASECRTIFW